MLDEGDLFPICGRPLGLAFDTIENNLIVMDSSNGIYKLNIDTHEIDVIIAASQPYGSNVNFLLQILSFYKIFSLESSG